MRQDAGLMPGVRVGELSTMVRGLYPRPLPLGDLVGIADLGSLLGQRADRLSGGQAQRVRFAAAIADDPLLLVLDEPTAAMDVPARRNFWRQIHGFAGRGRTVLFATHYLHEADDAADRVVVIAAGRKIADAPSPAAIKARFGDRQVRFNLVQGSSALLAVLEGVRSVEQDHSRAILHSGDTDATVRPLAGSGLRRSGLERAAPRPELLRADPDPGHPQPGPGRALRGPGHRDRRRPGGQRRRYRGAAMRAIPAVRGGLSGRRVQVNRNQPSGAGRHRRSEVTPH